MRLINYLKGLGIVIATTSLLNCGSGSCAPADSANGNLTLTITAPNEYPAGIAATAYLTMTNTSTINATNLFYAVPDETNHTGATISVTNDSSQPCKNIAAGQSCTFPAQISANSNPGSFTVTATPNITNNLTSLSFKKLKTALGLKSDTLSLTANIGLANIAANTQNNANGITFLYFPTITGSESNSTQIAIVAIVNSANASAAGAFNTINLTNSNGDLLDFSVLSDNSGNGKDNLSLGSIVTFLLTIPKNTSSYQFFAQTMKDGTILNTATNANPINLMESDSGILVVQPTNFSLYNSPAEYNTQVITYTNTGNLPITNLEIAAPSTNSVSLTSCSSSTLEPGSSCSATLTLNTASSQSGADSLHANSSAGSVSTNFNYATQVPVVTAILSSSEDTATPISDPKIYQTFFVYFTLSGGYQESDIINTAYINGNNYGNCTIPEGQSTCTVAITLTNQDTTTITTSTFPYNITTDNSTLPSSITALGRYAYIMSTSIQSTAASRAFNKIFILPYNITDGSLATATTSVSLSTGTPQTLASSLDGKYLYVNIINNTTSEVQILCYQVDSSSGALTLSSNPIITIAGANGSAYNSLKFDSSGKHLYIAYKTNSGGGIAVYDYNASNGELNFVSAVAAGTNPNFMTFTQDGNYMYLSNTVSGAGGMIYMYSVNTNTGTLTPLNPATILSPVQFPSASLVESSDQYLYVTNVGGAGTPNNQLSIFNIDNSNGQLSVNNQSPIYTGSGPAAIIMDPTKGYLYTANYAANNISLFGMQSNGDLTNLSPATITSNGVGPASFATDPSKKYLYTVNSFDYSVQKYTFDSTGGLSLSGTVITITTNPPPVNVALAGYIIFGN